MNTVEKGIITLLKSAVTGEKYTLPEGFSLEEADGIVRKQSLLPLVFQGAYNCGLPENSQLMQRYKMQYYQHMLSSERQMHALEQIYNAFEANGIEYMPVKGCNMKKLYPAPELRPMGDADILIHPQQHEKIREVLEKLGFKYLEENEHVFEWQCGSLHVEFHKFLIPLCEKDYQAYYGTGWELAQKSQGCRYDLSVEDTFVFLLTHLAKHYRGAGVGCRHVLDLYVYRRKFAEMNEDYLRCELEKLRLAEFYANTMRLLDVWFDGAQSDEVSELMTAFIFSGGNWGSFDTRLCSAAVRATKKSGKDSATAFRAVLKALFPSRSSLAYRYKVLMKYPALLPLVWLVRWFDLVVLRHKEMRRKLTILGGVDDKAVSAYQTALHAVGLDFYFDEDK